jgi:hypothetical protein
MGENIILNRKELKKKIQSIIEDFLEENKDIIIDVELLTILNNFKEKIIKNKVENEIRNSYIDDTIHDMVVSYVDEYDGLIFENEQLTVIYKDKNQYRIKYFAIDILAISYFSNYRRYDDRFKIYKEKLIEDIKFFEKNKIEYMNSNNEKILERKILLEMWVKDNKLHTDKEIKFMWDLFLYDNPDIKFEMNPELKANYINNSYNLIELLCGFSTIDYVTQPFEYIKNL